MDETAPLDKYEQHVDLMNECRAFYYSRVQKTEHYREVFSKGQTRQQGSSKEMSPFVSSMQKLQREIVSTQLQITILGGFYVFRQETHTHTTTTTTNHYCTN